MAKQYIICGQYIANGHSKTAVFCLRWFCDFYSLDEVKQNPHKILVFDSPQAVEAEIHKIARSKAKDTTIDGANGLRRVYPVRLNSANCPVTPIKQVDACYLAIKNAPPGLSGFVTQYAVK